MIEREIQNSSLQAERPTTDRIEKVKFRVYKQRQLGVYQIDVTDDTKRDYSEARKLRYMEQGD